MQPDVESQARRARDASHALAVDAGPAMRGPWAEALTDRIVGDDQCAKSVHAMHDQVDTRRVCALHGGIGPNMGTRATDAIMVVAPTALAAVKMAGGRIDSHIV